MPVANRVRGHGAAQLQDAVPPGVHGPQGDIEAVAPLS